MCKLRPILFTIATFCLWQTPTLAKSLNYTSDVTEPDGKFRYKTEVYDITISYKPVRIEKLLVRLPEGEEYQEIISPVGADDNLATTLIAGVATFSEYQAGDLGAIQVREAPYGVELKLMDILVGGEINANWTFIFHDTGFEHQIDWTIGKTTTFKNLGHQWRFNRQAEVLVNGQPLGPGDQPGIKGVYQVLLEDVSVVLDTVLNSTRLAGGTYTFPDGIAFNNVHESFNGKPLPAGIHSGGRWLVSFVEDRKFDPEVATKNPIGQYTQEGEYFKDFFHLKDGETHHLFYNVGKAGKTQFWQDQGNEDRFGHATSKDLKNWTRLPDKMHAIPGTWEGKVVSAPSILKKDDIWYMIYTGFSDKYHGEQSIGLATSKDLNNWTRYENNPVYVGPEWTNWTAGKWADCRDAHIIEVKDNDGKPVYYMFTTVYQESPRIGAIAIARSRDLKDWEDLGSAATYAGNMESPIVFQRNGWTYLITTGGGRAGYMTQDITSNDWIQFPFKFPEPPLWSAFEVIEEDGDFIISAFEWTKEGNRIVFWELGWDGDIPFIKY